MKKILKIAGLGIVLIATGVILYVIFNFYQSIKPAFLPAPQNIAETGAEAKNNLGLKLPSGFSISIFAENLPGARVMAIDKLGNMWVSQPSEGIITELDIKDGKVVASTPIFKNLKNPHGLAFDPQDGIFLYFAEEDKISKVRLYTEDKPKKIADLPSNGGHFTRTLGFGPDGRLYVSVGSSCNVCYEKDSRRAAIYLMNKDGSNFKEFARGLRNAVFFTWSYIDGKMWATEMGRDYLGDNLPPDEINIIKQGEDYGWPICYGKNVHDTNFDKNIYVRDPCADKTPSYIDIPAHSAPLGLAFVPEEGWPRDYWYNLFVSYHGSWNSTEPTGYKVVRIKLDEKGNYMGTEDFITGWLADKRASGRPVDILIQPGGIMYISDDKAGVIYKAVY